EREEPSNRGVGGGDLPVVEAGRVAGPVRFRRGVRGMRFVEMEQGEHRTAGDRLDPSRELLHGLTPGTFVGRLRIESVVVQIEAGGQTPVRAQSKRGDGGTGRVARSLEDTGEGRDFFRQPEPDV